MTQAKIFLSAELIEPLIDDEAAGISLHLPDFLPWPTSHMLCVTSSDKNPQEPQLQLLA